MSHFEMLDVSQLRAR